MNSAAATGTQSFSFDVQVCHSTNLLPWVALHLTASGILDQRPSETCSGGRAWPPQNGQNPERPAACIAWAGDQSHPCLRTGGRHGPLRTSKTLQCWQHVWEWLVTRSVVACAQVAGMAPQAVLDRMQSMAPMRPTETMAQQALGGSAGGTYLAPALYRPVVQAGPLLCFTLTMKTMMLG